jgi:hypothetical protein
VPVACSRVGGDGFFVMVVRTRTDSPHHQQRHQDPSSLGGGRRPDDAFGGRVRVKVGGLKGGGLEGCRGGGVEGWEGRRVEDEDLGGGGGWW